MKKLVLIILCILIHSFLFSQNLDLIVRTNGDSIACKIDSVTESQVFLNMKTPRSQKWVQIVEDLNSVNNFEYNVINPNLYVFKTGSTVIVRKRKLPGIQNLDLVITTAGDSIACKIDSISESQIFLQIKTPRSKQWVQIVEDLNTISSFEHNVINPELYVFKTGSTIIIGKRNLFGYRDLKHIYSHKNYFPADDDKYDPSLAGVLSLIPGLGLCYAGEPLRSLGYVGGMAGSFGVMALGFAMAWGGAGAGAALFIAGAGGVIIFYIASFIDAVKVAKVRNMAIRDKKLSINFTPKIELKNNYSPSNSFGLQVALSF